MPYLDSTMVRVASAGVVVTALGLGGCANRISDTYNAKSFDRVTSINEKVLTQFDRLLTTPLVCRPRLTADESFIASYGEIEVLLRTHRLAEEIRPANAESTTVASLYLVSWQLHRLSHQLWAAPHDESLQILQSTRAQLQRSTDVGRPDPTPELTLQRAQQELSAMLKTQQDPTAPPRASQSPSKAPERLAISNVPVRTATTPPPRDTYEARQVSYAETACAAVMSGNLQPDPKLPSAPEELVHLNSGYLGDRTLLIARDQYIRYGRAALVIEEARLVIASQKPD